MQKICIYKPGDHQHLKIESSPDLSISESEVLVRTKAIGVNYADVLVRWGVYKSAKEYVGWPITPGFEFSGEVISVGSQVSKFKVGDPVFGVTRFDAYAEQVKVPESQLFHLPSELTFEEAAAFPAVYMTAYHALFQNFVLRPDMWVLVHSAAGGVGTALLQLAKVGGCKTVGVVGSSHKVQTAKDFGADYVIDKSKQDIWEEVEKICPQGFDVILDANGPETLKQGFKHLASCGKLVTYGYHTMLPKDRGTLDYFKLLWGLAKLPVFLPMKLCDSNKSVVGFNLSFLFERQELLQEAMEDLIAWLKEGKIKPLKVEVYPFQEVAEAHRKIESGTSVGKLVLIPY